MVNTVTQNRRLLRNIVFVFLVSITASKILPVPPI